MDHPRGQGARQHLVAGVEPLGLRDVQGLRGFTVGRQGSHVDNDRREAGRKLRIPRRVHTGSKEQSDTETSYLYKQWDRRYAHKDQQYDCICDVAQFAGRRDCRTDEAVELPPLVPSGLSCIGMSH